MGEIKTDLKIKKVTSLNSLSKYERKLGICDKNNIVDYWRKDWLLSKLLVIPSTPFLVLVFTLRL